MNENHYNQFYTLKTRREPHQNAYAIINSNLPTNLHLNQKRLRRKGRKLSMKGRKKKMYRNLSWNEPSRAQIQGDLKKAQ